MAFSISPMTNFYLVFCFTNLLYSSSSEYETENGNYSSQEKKNRILAF